MLVNYFAHAWIASRVRPEARFIWGAILPDLAGFLRIRLPDQPDPEVAEGMALHHACDAIFHALPGFRERKLAGIRTLRALGLGRGPARAASHVGIEIVLDAALAAACPRTLEHFADALGASERLVCSTPEDFRAIQQMAQRLSEFEPAADLGAADQVAESVRRTLEHRPALALQPGDLAPLADWLRGTELELTADAESLAHETLRCASA